MREYLLKIYNDYFSDPQAISLLLLLVGGTLGIVFLGEILAPVIIAAVLAYLLHNLVEKLVTKGMPRLIAVVLVCVLVLATIIVGSFVLVPMLSRQVEGIASELPHTLEVVRALIRSLPEKYPTLFVAEQVQQMENSILQESTRLGQRIVTATAGAAGSILTFAVYFVLVPLLVFFFLKDSALILTWVRDLLPTDRRLATGVWREVDEQIGNYIRGKTWEILIVWAAAYIAFLVLELRFAMLLSLFVGLSVLIPYVGATLMTLPVAWVAFVQWGLEGNFAATVVTYLVLQALDGNVLVPILFSEAVDLHPVAIITAILLFGGIWGFWGVFFAIPLATLVRAVMRSWPKPQAALTD